MKAIEHRLVKDAYLAYLICLGLPLRFVLVFFNGT